MVNDAVRARNEMLASIRRELVGPAPKGQPLPIPTPTEPVDEYVPYVDAATGQEVLSVELPLQRYGVAVLHPRDIFVEDTEAEVPDNLEGSPDSVVQGAEDASAVDWAQAEKLEKLSKRNQGTEREGPESAAADLVDTSRRHASSLAVSFRMVHKPGAKFEVSLPSTESLTGAAVNGRYEKFEVNGLNPQTKAVNRRSWWVRRPVSGLAEFRLADMSYGTAAATVERTTMSFEGNGPLSLEFLAYARRFPGGAADDLIVTVVLASRSQRRNAKSDDLCLFQVHMEVKLQAEVVTALPGAQISDEAAGSLNLLYSKAKTLAIGHGCAADWHEVEGHTIICATHFPVFETSSLTPDLKDTNGEPLSISMRSLSRADDGRLEDLRALISSYSAWIDERQQELVTMPTSDRHVAERHVDQARSMLERMRSGLELLSNDEVVRQAFCWMNRAMALQQTRSRLPTRKLQAATKTQVASFDHAFPPVEDATSASAGKWRPFQIGFILAALASTADSSSSDRELVDLIWFPTGGGKTEAYLGLVAFSAFLRRLKDPEDAGTDVLMRYTLRLLTAQQFQRGSSLVCAMDYIRRQHVAALGTVPYSIGLWVGSSTTSNTWQDAAKALNDLTTGRSSLNPFLVTKCPWCGAVMGPRQVGKQRWTDGYKKEPGRVKVHCPDPKCDFHSELPVRMVDEDIYDRPPTILIGTVDKFAQLSWRDQPRSLFGLDGRGERSASPPNLIIQDELHLITGPLGTMVGAFEPVVEHLCRYKTDGDIRPKIVCSTATIRNYSDQIRWLFGRTRTSVFPPPMFDIDDSFFGVRARNEDGTPAPGRTYVGVYASALGSHMAAQVRAYAATLQGVLDLPEDRRDPYWTLLGFFNTLRDLGSTTTMLKLLIQGQLEAMWRRAGILGKENGSKRRERIEPIELTGRLRSEEVPEALDRLSVEYGQDDSVVDVCLASNMIEVGIDIDRLGMMVVTGQPKTNSQYIQVTGRVGRRWAEKPGIVVVVYSPNRARDRSVFESFRTNHERMYAAVEPASVTPYSLPALRRTLHATMLAYLRQTLARDEVESPESVDLSKLEQFTKIVKERLDIVDPDAWKDFRDVYSKRIHQWNTLRQFKWNNWTDNSDLDVLMLPAGEGEESWSDPRWRIPQSLRNVDLECVVDTNIVGTMEAQVPS